MSQLNQLVLAALNGLDGGVKVAPALSAEDQELVDDLELLENLGPSLGQDSATDLELLQELSVDR
jgi:hypothetical protein